ncbi:MAG: hypothetical protein KDA69_06835 [Planctomycetaceae bacterium]|nr:hypothetical protein [Planctomycetaceae bacterium]MCB9951084.1 hypothetical protein [Planctomycetaceae bacterium]
MILHTSRLSGLWKIVLLLSTPVFAFSSLSYGQVIPGTGEVLVTDDFEDSSWEFNMNWPKSSKEEDEQVRYPLGRSTNGMWTEGPKRGFPDTVKWVETPAGGLSGSNGALYMRSRDTGIPGRPGFKQAQDDFVLSGRSLSPSYYPNYTVRVYIPEWDQWEQRPGVSFGIRAGLQGPQTKEREVKGVRFFGRRNKVTTEMEPFYPGFFLQFFPENDPNNPMKKAHALILIRADHNGHEVAGPRIMESGWWTFGMTLSPDGQCHYYAHPGVEEFTAADHLYSSIPYTIRATAFNTVFFNICSGDDGRTWSTPWIIDDPKIYYVKSGTLREARR